MFAWNFRGYVSPVFTPSEKDFPSHKVEIKYFLSPWKSWQHYVYQSTFGKVRVVQNPPRRSLLTRRWHERFTSFSATLAGLVGGWNRFQGVLAWGGECPVKSEQRKILKKRKKKSTTATITNNINKQPTTVVWGLSSGIQECGIGLQRQYSFKGPSVQQEKLKARVHELTLFINCRTNTTTWSFFLANTGTDTNHTKEGVTLKALCSNLDRKAPKVESVGENHCLQRENYLPQSMANLWTFGILGIPRILHDQYTIK